MSFDIDADVAQARAAMESAHEQDKVAAIQTGNMTSASAPDVDPVRDWMLNLPRNASVAVMDAATNTVDAAKVFGDHVWANLKAPGAAQEYANTEQGKTPEGETPEQLREKFLAQPMVQETHGPVRQAFQAFRDSLAEGSNTSDDVTQGLIQFGIPLFGWSKLLGVHKAISVGAALAEGATAATALAPHQGRTADMLALGKQVEGKLGDTLNTIAPDGSALNAYINYMTDRTNESDAEGRFKNVIDSLVTTATGATLIKTGAATLKTGMRLPGYIAENAGTGPVGLGAQEGKIVFHGTPHDFNEFSTDKIGSGEGNQSFGHGLYFAENPDTAGGYQRRLTSKNPDLTAAQTALAAAGGDKQRAFVKLSGEADSATDPSIKSARQRAASLIKSGAVDKRGNLMHVDVPDDVIGQMLDHDKDMSQQMDVLNKIPQADKDQLEQMLVDHDKHEDLTLYTGNQFRQLVRRAISEDYLSFTPKDGNFDNMDKIASEYLDSKGIPGIKYLDQGSRKSGEGTRNLVLFDAKHARIVKKE